MRLRSCSLLGEDTDNDIGEKFSLGKEHAQIMRLRREEDWEKTHGIYIHRLKERIERHRTGN